MRVPLRSEHWKLFSLALFSAVTAASGAAAQITPLFDVDFNQDGVGAAPAVGVEPYPSSKPSELFVSYSPAPPLVESAVGTLTDQPLKFYFQFPVTGQYQQLRFNLPATGCGPVFVDFDLLVTQPPVSSLATFTVLVDFANLLGTHRFDFRHDGTIGALAFGGAPVIGSYPFDTPIHVAVEAGGRDRAFNLWVDGALVFEGKVLVSSDYPIPSRVRIGTQSLQDFVTGLDNVEIGCGPVERVLPGLGWLGSALLLGLFVLAGMASLSRRSTA